MTRWLWFSIALTGVAVAGTLYLFEFHRDLFPEKVPIHWNAGGVADDFRPREQVLPYLLIAPAVMAGMILLTFVLPWLSPRQFSIDRFRPTYEYIMGLVVALFGFVQLCLLLSSLRDPPVDGIRLMIAGMLLFFALMGNVMGKVRRNFWVGIRTPWTLASDLVWNQTHRVAAWLWVAGSLIGFVAVLLGVNLLVVFIPFIILVLIPVPYSLVLYKRLQREGKLEAPSETVS